MTRRIGFRALLCATIAIVWVLSGRPSPAGSLRLLADFAPPLEDLSNEEAPGFSVEVLRQVFAAMGQDVSFEAFPNRPQLDDDRPRQG